MLGGWCVRDTSLLCTVHPLSFKHSDHCVRVDPSTSPYHCPALAPVWRVTCFYFGGPACLRFLSAAGSLWEALRASCDIRVVHQKVAKGALILVFTEAVAELWWIPSHSKINAQRKTFEFACFTVLTDIGSNIVVCEYTVCGCMKPLSHVQSVRDMFRNSYCMGSCVNLRRDRHSGKICTANFPSQEV